MLAVLKRRIKGQQEQAPGDARAWGQLNCVDAAHGME